MGRNSKSLSNWVTGRKLISLKRLAGLQCPGEKRRIELHAEHAPMGLHFLSRNESGCQRSLTGSFMVIYRYQLFRMVQLKKRCMFWEQVRGLQ